MPSVLGDTNNRNLSLFAADLATEGHRPAASESSFEPHLLTALQVARMLSVSKRQVWRLTSAGILPGRVKIGKLVRWRRDQIERWIVKGCPKGQRRS
jgi:excisionase family DNA binding protein